MKIAKITIKNFRSFKSEGINFQDLMVLIGENNTGKSNVLKAMDLFFSNIKTIDEECFNNPEEKITIKILFNGLTPEIKKIHSKYLLDDNESVLIKKEYYFNKEIPANVFALMCQAKVKKDEKNIKEITVLEDIKEYNYNIDKKYYWKENPFGLKGSVEVGYGPKFLYIPAIKDAKKETESKEFSELINVMLSQIVYDKNFIENYEKLCSLLVISKDRGDERLKQIKELENDLSERLSKYMKNTSMQLDVSPPNISDFLKKNTRLLINDGLITSIESKGHGLQRSVIFVIFQAYADSLREKVKTEKERTQSFIFGIEEPEIYLHPQMQRTLLEILNEISINDQVIFTTHSSFFVDVANYKSINIVIKNDQSTGTKITQYTDEIFTDDIEKKEFQLLNEFDPERNEMFFGRRVLLVEGDTKKVTFPLVARKMGHQFILHENNISIIETGGKGNLILFAKVLNALKLPYIIIYDEDRYIEEKYEGGCGVCRSRIKSKNESKKRDFGLNGKIQEVVSSSKGIGKLEMLIPDFEGVCESAGIKIPSKSKPFAAYKKFKDLSLENIPLCFKEIIKNIYT